MSWINSTSTTTPSKHTFEKIETAEAFSSVTRTPAGADELAHHADALDEFALCARW